MSARQSDGVTISSGTLRRVGSLVASLVGIVIVVVLVILAVRWLTPNDTLASAVDSSKYQAVFLANGQVYFGKLSVSSGDFCSLRNVYYLSNQASPQNPKAPRQTLIKLGNEIHGPEDQMVIARSQILFVENLKRSGRVTQAILHSQPP